jgi:hypothetical protein
MNTRKSVGLLLAMSMVASGCVFFGRNGDTRGGDTMGSVIRLFGYDSEPGILLDVMVLENPDRPAGTLERWARLAAADGAIRTGTTPLEVNDPEHPLYSWQAFVTPVSSEAQLARWPRGGVVTLKVVAHASIGDRELTSFDAATFDDCYFENASRPWQAIGARCQSPNSPNIRIASTANNPADGATRPAYLSRRTPPVGETSAEAARYYTTIGAPANLAAFKAAYHFGGGDGDEASAIYYNQGDLGLGRDMHCRRDVDSSGGEVRVCYVSNHGANFDVDARGALARAIRGDTPAATVAMVFRKAVIGPNRMQFIAYKADGSRANELALDTTGQNKAIPYNCLVCHGGTYSNVDHTVTGGHFLPFDVGSYQFSDSDPRYSLRAQFEAFRRLNQHVLQADPTPAIRDFVAGQFPPGATAPNLRYVPAGFSGEEGLYLGAIAPYCRTCHVAREGALSFTAMADLRPLAPVIKEDICGAAHAMPQAEVPLRHFWQSGARAYLIGSLGLPTSCPSRP